MSKDNAVKTTALDLDDLAAHGVPGATDPFREFDQPERRQPSRDAYWEEAGARGFPNRALMADLLRGIDGALTVEERDFLARYLICEIPNGVLSSWLRIYSFDSDES
jgi:hypothetical protein